jgi:hypothetical protein
MNREWITLAFGVLLVSAVAVVSVWHTYLGDPPGGNATPAETTAPAEAPPAASAVAAPPASTVDTAPSGGSANAPTPAGVGSGSTATPATRAPAVSRAPVTASTSSTTGAEVPVVHKHRFGDCEGTLRAVGGTLIYSTTHKEDGFRLAFADIEGFDVDAAAKNLRIRRRGGRTWNFTTRSESATALVAFHTAAARARR